MYSIDNPIEDLLLRNSFYTAPIPDLFLRGWLYKVYIDDIHKMGMAYFLNISQEDDEPRHNLTLLHRDISMYILQTVLYTFHKVLKRRICLTIKSSFSWWSFSLFS